jgi:hypothetical protein
MARILRADHRGQDRGGENADAVGPQILKEPRDRSEDRGLQVLPFEKDAVVVGGLLLPLAGFLTLTSLGYSGCRFRSRRVSYSASASRLRLTNQIGLSVTKNGPNITKMAGMIAIPYIQRYAAMCGFSKRITNPMPVPTKAPTAWKANAVSTNRPRALVGILSEITMCAVG